MELRLGLQSAISYAFTIQVFWQTPKLYGLVDFLCSFIYIYIAEAKAVFIYFENPKCIFQASQIKRRENNFYFRSLHMWSSH